MAEEEELTHAQKIDRHFKIIGKPNPFKTAHSGTPAQRKAGLGSGKGAARYQNTSAEDRRKANTDGKFGYFDEVNKRYVPAIFDMIDGGGRDTRGDEFKGGIFSGMLNDLGVKPYGSQMERAMVSPNTSPDVQTVFGSIPRPRVRPEQPMQFGDQPAGSMPSMSFGQQPAGSMPAANMQFGDQPAGSMPSMSFGQQPAGALPSMSFGQQPVGSMPSMSFGQQPAGSMPAAASGVTTQDMALADLQRRIDAVRQAGGTEEDMTPLLRLYSERIALHDPAMYGSNANEARLGQSAMNQVYNYLLPPKGFRP
jgi:hypothetical protein|tara:strand:+ start:1764 stop:2690 length:927 start_codon:yes stop_codon:yes gene_type:complete